MAIKGIAIGLPVALAMWAGIGYTIHLLVGLV